MADVDSRKERVDSGDVGLALLGFASGSMDALAFFNLGEVFPSAMTGNTALLGLALGQGHVIAASRPFVAFAGFLAGAIAAAASVDLWLNKLPKPRAVCWLLAADLLQRQLTAFLVKLLEAIKTVPRITHHFACLADVAELLRKLQQAYLGSNDLLILGHIGVLLKTPRRGAAQPRPAPRPASACNCRGA